MFYNNNGDIMNEMFFELVYGLLEEVPYGKVTTYGDIAKMIGKPKNARLVGTALKYANHYGDFPCHRVVHNDGSLAPFFDMQRELLEAEGITFNKDKVDMEKHRWKFF